MRIGILSAAYPAPTEPHRALFIEGLSRALARAARVMVVAPRVRCGDPLRARRRGLPVRRFPYPGTARLKERAAPAGVAAYLVSALVRTTTVLRAFSADAILCHWILPTGPVARIAGAWLGIPAVLYAHGSDVTRYALRGPVARRAARFALAGAARRIAASEEIAGILAGELGCPADAVFPVGVDGRHFRPGGGERPRRPRRLLVFVGDLSPDKGVLDILRARAILGRGGRWIFLGDGPLRREIARRRGSGCRALGPVGPADVARWLRRADALLLPSYREGTPSAPLEALACGTPVVASRVGGIPAWVADGVSGLLVEPGDAAGLARAILRLWDEPGLIVRLRRGAEAVAPPTWEDTARRLAAILASACGR